MTSRTRASTRARGRDDSTSSSSAHLPFAPSREERNRESEATSAATSSSTAGDAMARPRRLHPYRRSPRFACHFDGLAADEVHSIMQMLDRRSLLKLARCSKRLHTDADSDAAWSSQPRFNVVLQADDPDIGIRMQQSLLRHLPDVFAFTRRHETDPPVDVQSLLAIPRITSIWGGFGLSAEEWLQVLSHPCTAGLTTLIIEDPSLLGALPAELTAQLARLTRLESIMTDRSLSRSDLLAVLPSLPALASLHFESLRGSVDFASILPPALYACTRLVELSLGWPSDGSRLFRSIFCDVQSPSPAASFLSRLQHLTLEGFESIVSNTPASELSAAFTAMTGLRYLALNSVSDIDDLLPFVTLLGGLTYLDIRPNHRELHDLGRFIELMVDGSFRSSTIPTVPALQSVMQTSAVSHVMLHGCHCFSYDSDDPNFAFEQLDRDMERFTMDSWS